MQQDQAMNAVLARSVVVTGIGGSEVLDVQEREVPPPAPRQVRVQVSAGGVNFIDVYQRNGTHDMQFPFVAGLEGDRKSTRLNSSHVAISYAVFCLKKKI